MSLFKRFGFREWGTKSNGELVYYKDLEVLNDSYKDFPRISLLNSSQKHLLSIHPEFHTKLFPDSRLNTERNHFVEDLSLCFFDKCRSDRISSFSSTMLNSFSNSSKYVFMFFPRSYFILYSCSRTFSQIWEKGLFSTICQVCQGFK